jgi:hypothetical protein
MAAHVVLNFAPDIICPFASRTNAGIASDTHSSTAAFVFFFFFIRACTLHHALL